MGILGEILEVTRDFTFEWKIENFSSLSGDHEERYDSPSFSFDGKSWHLKICPNDQKEHNSVGYLCVYLYSDSGDPNKSYACSLGVKTYDGMKYLENHFTHVFEKPKGYGYPKFCKTSTLSEKKSELMPSDTLTITCTLEYSSKLNADAGNIVTAQCSYCKVTLDALYLSSHEKKCLSKPIRCSTCSDEIFQRDWINHECQMTRMKATKKLKDDLKDIFEGEHSDVTIKVKDEEFRLHRNILAGRNPFFDSMFKTEMREKSTGIVTIDDCEPQIFRSFIYFLYVADVDELSLENVCDLYEVADKYQADLLKEECLCFMKNKMSVDTFCDFIVLSLKHNEMELLELATELFCRKTKEIIQGVKWQTFMKEYSTQANELYIKALDFQTNTLKNSIFNLRKTYWLQHCRNISII